MDNFTRRKTYELIETYLRGDDGPLVSLEEINPDYKELLPKIREISEQIIEEKRSNLENQYQERIDDLRKELTDLVNRL